MLKRRVTLPQSKNNRNGKRRARKTIKHGGHPSVKRALASVITDRIKVGQFPYSTILIKTALKEGL